MKHFCVLILLLLSIEGISQSTRDSLLTDSNELVFPNRPESDPTHISGDNENLISAIYEKLKLPKGKCLSGITILTFNIDTSGNVVCPKISRSVDTYIDKQLLKEINNHTFIPGTLYGKKVETTVHLPIRICLNL